MNEFKANQNKDISNYDPELSVFLDRELNRQEEHIELIASENYASKRILEAQGSVLTNKYAEGYPNKRYYGGCEHVDGAETLAIERAKELFNVKYANVQPHSGASANAAVFLALLEPGDTFLGMALDQGGHLTHGAKVNFSGKNFNAIQYGLDEKTGEIDYAAVKKLAEEHKPKLIVAGFSAYMGIVDWKKFREIADSVGHTLWLTWLMSQVLSREVFIQAQSNMRMLLQAHINHYEAQDLELFCLMKMKSFKRN